MLKYLLIAILALTMGTNTANTAPGATVDHTPSPEYIARERAKAERRAMPEIYRKMSTVIETNKYDDSVIVVDENGEMWEFYGVEDWFVGDYCLLTFIDSGIRGYMWDDEIIGTIYRGWNEDYE